MLILLQILVLIVCISFLKLCKQIIYPIEFIVLFFMMLFVSSITIDPDIDNYIIAYTSKYLNFKDSGFSLCMRLARNLNLNFYEFRSFYLFACSLLFFISLKLILSPIWSVYLFYLFYPFILNVVQIRNYFIISAVLFAFAVCSRLEKKIVTYFVWVFLIWIASTQHIIALVYLPFVFLFDKDVFLYKIFTVMSAVSIFFALVSDSSLITFMQQGIALFDDSTRVDQYLERQSYYGFFLVLFEALGMIYIAQKAVWINHLQMLLMKKNVFVDGNYRIPKFILNFFLYGSFFFPLYVWGGSFMRLVQVQIVFLYILVVSVFQMVSFFPGELKRFYKLNGILLNISVVFAFIFLINSQVIWVELWNVVVEIFSNLVFLFAYFY